MKKFELALYHIERNKINFIRTITRKNHFRTVVQVVDKNCNIVFYHKMEIFHYLINRIDFKVDCVDLMDKLHFINHLRENLQSNIYKVKFICTGL